VQRNPQTLWEEYRKRIADAKNEDFKSRAEAWVQLPHQIAGTLLSPMTLRKLIFLEQVESPLLSGKDATHEDVVTFIWVCSDQFTPNEAAAKAFRQGMGKFPESLEQEITDYLKDNLSHINQGGESSPSNAHFASSVIDLMASEYGWTSEQILDLPLSQMFQLLSSITQRLTVTNGGTPIEFNPAVDKLKAEFLKQANMGN